VSTVEKDNHEWTPTDTEGNLKAGAMVEDEEAADFSQQGNEGPCGRSQREECQVPSANSDKSRAGIQHSTPLTREQAPNIEEETAREDSRPTGPAELANENADEWAKNELMGREQAGLPARIWGRTKVITDGHREMGARSARPSENGAVPENQRARPAAEKPASFREIS
jgi:hypothetical protein